METAFIKAIWWADGFLMISIATLKATFLSSSFGNKAEIADKEVMTSKRSPDVRSGANLRWMADMFGWDLKNDNNDGELREKPEIVDITNGEIWGMVIHETEEVNKISINLVDEILILPE